MILWLLLALGLQFGTYIALMITKSCGFQFYNLIDLFVFFFYCTIEKILNIIIKDVIDYICNIFDLLHGICSVVMLSGMRLKSQWQIDVLLDNYD